MPVSPDFFAQILQQIQGALPSGATAIGGTSPTAQYSSAPTAFPGSILFPEGAPSDVSSLVAPTSGFTYGKTGGGGGGGGGGDAAGGGAGGTLLQAGKLGLQGIKAAGGVDPVLQGLASTGLNLSGYSPEAISILQSLAPGTANALGLGSSVTGATLPAHLGVMGVPGGFGAAAGPAFGNVALDAAGAATAYGGGIEGAITAGLSGAGGLSSGSAAAGLAGLEAGAIGAPSAASAAAPGLTGMAGLAAPLAVLAFGPTMKALFGKVDDPLQRNRGVFSEFLRGAESGKINEAEFNRRSLFGNLRGNYQAIAESLPQGRAPEGVNLTERKLSRIAEAAPWAFSSGITDVDRTFAEDYANYRSFTDPASFGIADPLAGGTGKLSSGAIAALTTQQDRTARRGFEQLQQNDPAFIDTTFEQWRRRQALAPADDPGGL